MISNHRQGNSWPPVDLLGDMPGWLEEFTDNLVDGEASASGSEMAGSSEPHHLEPSPKVGSGY